MARFHRRRSRGDSRRLPSLPLGRPLRYQPRETHERDDPPGRCPGGLHGEMAGRGATTRPRGSSGSYPSGTPALVPLTTASDAGSGAG